ncbi:ubiquitin-specific protease 5 [Wolffia australiana]
MEGAVCSAQLTPEEERLVIRDITITAEAQCKEGDDFYLITHRWWQHWLDYVNQEVGSSVNNGSSPYGSHYLEGSSAAQKRPSVIDNSDLINESTPEVSNVGIELHDALVEGRDYILLPQGVWKQLYGWYGGGPILARKAISSGSSQPELAIEVYPLRLQLLMMPKGNRAVIRISKKETVGELHRKACEIFDLLSEQVSIWDYYGQHKHTLMDNMDKTLDDSNIQMDQEILVEEYNDGSMHSRCMSSVQDNGFIDKDATHMLLEPSRSSLSVAGGLSASKNFSRSCSSELLQGQYLASPGSDMDNSLGTNGMGTRGASIGLTGLLNLGNTCFMNSAIQCLVHTPEFSRYFREDYRREINWQNPLGMVGELALAFGELLRKLWAPGRTPVSPRPFKTKLARFAPQFSGYNQHDSQEFLAFLLDGLHEDLNRVKHKPYVKTNDVDGRPDEEVADEFWANHISRNDSIIVDVCQGQFKSTLVCPVCDKVSVTFDPFMYLSLPLQSAHSRSMTVTVFASDGSAPPTPCTVSVPKQGRCKDLTQAISTACSVKNGERILLAEIRGHLIHRFLEDPLVLLSTIKDDDHLAAYRLPKKTADAVYLQLIHRHEEWELGSATGSVVWRPYGTPLVSSIIRNDAITRGDIQSMVQKMLSPMVRSEKNTTKLKTASGTEGIRPSGSCSDYASMSDSSSEDHQTPSPEVPSKLPLHMIDENNVYIDLSIGEEKIVRAPSSLSSMRVFIDWSRNDLQNYDTSVLENLPEVLKYAPVAKKSRSEPLSLYACLEAFLREEPLVPEEMWYCPRCKEQRQASKKLDLWRLPEVLVIHLKRFSYSRSNKHKLETFINFPIHDFDLTNYVAKDQSQRQLYELYALSNHYGSMASGHYTAHIKLLEENRWYNFDDSHLSPINEEDVKSAAAYVLFYRRVKCEGSSGTNGLQTSVDCGDDLLHRI